MSDFGDGSVLDPPITYNGEQYSFGFRFKPAPSVNDDGEEIVSGKIVEATDQGSSVWKIVCERALQYSSYTKAIPGEGSVEVVTTHSCGGNIANSREEMRVVSWNNPISARGSLEAIRAVPGDGLRMQQGSKTYLWEVLTSEAYAEEPDEVNYAGEEPVQTIGYIDADVTSVAVTTEQTGGGDGMVAGTTVWFDQAAYPDSVRSGGLYLHLSGVTTAGERQLFVVPSGNPDETYLPPDFGSGVTGPKYWYDPAAYEIRLADSCALYGETATLYWTLENAKNLPDLPTNSYVVLQSESGATGFDDAGDAYCLSAFDVAESFDHSFSVWGRGSIGWRFSTLHTAPFVALSFDEDGIFSASKRDEQDGSVSAIAASGSLSYPFEVRAIKSGTAIEIQTRQTSGDSWDTKVSDYPSSLPSKVNGLLGMGLTGTGETGCWVNATSRTYHPIGAAQGTQHLGRTKTFDLSFSKRFPKPSPEAIASVYNITGGFAMNESSTTARNTYTVDGDSIVLSSEASGDRLRITCAAPEEAPEPPGDAPRTFNQPDFAEYAGDEENPQLASSDTTTNKANWRDVLTIKVEDAGFAPLVGETFTIVRGRGVWSEAPSVYVDFRNGDSDWTLVDPSNYYLRAYHGVLLLKKSFVDTLPKENPLCVKVEGRRYKAGTKAYNTNELKHAVEMLDELWTHAFVTGGETTATSGVTSPLTIGRTGSDCEPGDSDFSTSYFFDTGYAWGTEANIVREYNNLTVPEPHWEPYKTATWFEWNRGSSYTGEEETMVCQFSDDQDTDLKHYRGSLAFTVPEECALYSFPFESNVPVVRDHWRRENRTITGYVGDVPIIADEAVPAMTNFFGGTPADGCFNVTSILSQFSFSPIAFGVPDLFKRLPAGTEIVEAIARVKFDGFRSIAWSSSLSFEPKPPRADIGWTPSWMHWTYSEQGQLVASYDKEDGVEESYAIPVYPEPTHGGSVSFRLIGYRKNTEYVEFYTGDLGPTPAGNLYSLGQGISTGTATDGEWSHIDVTSLMQSVADNKDNEYSSFFLYPTTNSLDSDDSVGQMSSFLRSLMPQHTVTMLSGDDGARSWSQTCAGTFSWYSTLQVDSILVRFRLPNGTMDKLVLPLIQPKAMRL